MFTYKTNTANTDINVLLSGTPMGIIKQNNNTFMYYPIISFCPPTESFATLKACQASIEGND